MRYYFIAGEPSGDLHASNCMRELIRFDRTAEFGFTGGDRMEKFTGLKADIHIRDMAFMGFVDVLKNIGAIKRNFKIVKKKIVEFNPDLLILVDYPGFNLRMARWASENGIRADYYISPTVWAWKEGRVELIRKYVNKLYVILPFEEAFYLKHGLKVTYIGHPLIDAIEQAKSGLPSRDDFLRRNSPGGKPVIAVLPGSRVQEIERMLGVMSEVVNAFPEYRFIVAASENLPKKYFSELEKKNVGVVYGQTYELLISAEAGIIKSGTSTLESALFKLPQVVCYRGGDLSFRIAKLLVNVKYISLVNLIMDKEVVKELIQDDFTPANITTELRRLLEDKKYRQEILNQYDELRKLLGGAGASSRLAAQLADDAINLPAA